MALGSSMMVAVDLDHAVTTSRFNLVSVNPGCLPDASGRVTVVHKEDALGVDTLQLSARGLPPRTDFAAFLTTADAFTAPAFGATAYIGDFTTNSLGIGSLRVAAVIGEAFISREWAPPTRVRTDLDHVVIWFADPAQVPACFNFSGATPFDGDGQAGPAALSSLGATGLEVLP